MNRTVYVRRDTLTDLGFTDVFKLTVVTQLLSWRREITSHKFRKGKEVQFLLYGFNRACIWPIAVSEHPQYNFTKIRPVGAQLLHMDRQTDMTRLLTVAFRSCFPKASKRNTRYCRRTTQCDRLNRRMLFVIRCRRLELKVAGQSRYSPFWFITTVPIFSILIHNNSPDILHIDS